MPEMSEFELIALLDEAETDSVAFNGEFMAENEVLLNYYLAEPFGDEVEGRSQVVSTDVADVVEADMPSLARIFLGSGDVVTFNANTDDEGEIQEAEDKTAYVNWLIRKQPESFTTLHGWLKDAEIQKMGVLKYFIEDTRKTSTERFKGVDRIELQQIIESLQGEDVSKVEVTEQSVNEPEGLELGDEVIPEESFNVTFKVTRGEQKVRIINVPTESFLISRNASSLEDAEMVGDRMLKTRGELLSEGFDRELISKLPTHETAKVHQSELKQIRFENEGGDFNDTLSDWASQEVEIIDMSIMIDFDGDGIAERRRIIKSGSHILENEQFEHIPYAMISGILMPHKAIGRSRAEITKITQRVKSVVLRQTLDNMYFVNNARNVVSDAVNLDDMLTVRPNGIVRTEGDVQSAVFPLTTDYVGDKALQIIQYLDFARAQTTGTLMASQGLSADSLNAETATRFQGLQDEGSAKIELVARVYAETGFRKLYEGIAWLVAQFQDSGKEFRVLGKSMSVDPSNWKFNHHVESSVGLGSGDNDKLTESMSVLLTLQQQLQQTNPGLIDSKKIFNSTSRIIKGLGLPRVDEFINDPEQPDELLLAENEQLKAMIQQMQQQVEQLQNPLAEAEGIRAEAALIKAEGDQQIKLLETQGKQELDFNKLLEDQRQFNVSAAQEQRQFNEELATKLTELELKFNQNVPGAKV